MIRRPPRSPLFPSPTPFRPPAPPPAGRLFFGEHAAAGGRARGAEVVDGVERRVEPAEQPALGHPPPSREIGARDAVERQPRHSAYPIVRTPTIQLYGANA